MARIQSQEFLDANRYHAAIVQMAVDAMATPDGYLPLTREIAATLGAHPKRVERIIRNMRVGGDILTERCTDTGPRRDGYPPFVRRRVLSVRGVRAPYADTVRPRSHSESVAHRRGVVMAIVKLAFARGTLLPTAGMIAFKTGLTRHHVYNAMVELRADGLYGVRKANPKHSPRGPGRLVVEWVKE